MIAGRMKQTITIERGTKTTGPGGISTTTWATIATRKAQIIQASTGEFVKPFGEQETASIVYRIRYVDGVTTADRLTHRGQHFNIREIKEIGLRRGLDLRCEKVTI